MTWSALLRRMRSVHLGATPLLIAVAALAASACGPTITGLRVDPSFTYPELTAGKIGVGGVVALVKDVSDEDLAGWSSQFASGIAEKREKVDVVSPGVVANRVGDDVLKRANAEYRNGEVNPATLSALKEKAGSLRYLAFVRVEESATGKRRYETSGDKYSSAQMVSESTRRVTAAANIYDLKTGLSVWSASLTKVDANRNAVDKPPPLLALIQMATSKPPSYPEYPTNPETGQVLMSIFKGVGENLPKP